MNFNGDTARNGDSDDEAARTSMTDWPVEEVIGEEMIDGKKYYWVVWEPSLVSEADAANSKRLIEEWETRKKIHRAQAATQLAKTMRERVGDEQCEAPRGH